MLTNAETGFQNNHFYVHANKQNMPSVEDDYRLYVMNRRPHLFSQDAMAAVTPIRIFTVSRSIRILSFKSQMFCSELDVGFELQREADRSIGFHCRSGYLLLDKGAKTECRDPSGIC